MSTWVWIAIVVAIVVVAAAAWLYTRQRRREALREQFGPEYERAVKEYGGRERAESVLEARRERVERLRLRPLAPDERERFADEWQRTQARFVDDPSGAVEEADRLVTEVMRARGYPMEDFELRAADISVEYPDVVENYRRAHEIAQRSERDQASTEDLRQAFVYYRSLFDNLLKEETRTEARR